MSSPGWIIFILLMFFTNLIIGNIFSGELQPVTSLDSEILGETTHYPTTEESTTSGSIIAFFNATGNAFSLLAKALTADYDFFYDYDPVTQTRTPNETYVLRYYFLLVNFGVFITLCFVVFKYV